jgi:ABC-type multidrug transport system permease subunit
MPTIARVFNESREHGRLARRSKLRVGPTIAVGALTLVLCVSISLLYVGWQPGSSLSLTGFIAMALGLLAAIMLGIGIVLLIHHDKHDR